LKKLSEVINNKFGIILLAAVILYGCGKEEPKKNFIARVDETYLTKKELSVDIDTAKLQESHKNEYIRNWIETELLYKEAIKEDIPEEDVFKRITEKSQKELAGALLLQKFFDEHEIEYKQQDLLDYFNSHKDEFKLFFDSFLYNSITFNDEDKAILFRSTLLESDWNRTSNVFSGDSSIINEKTNILQYDYQIQPVVLLDVIKELLPNEVSIVLNLEPNQYTVVQIVKKFSKGEIPDYDIIKKIVIDRFLTIKREELLQDFLRQLYLKYRVEIKKGSG
jgi:hypothetical protein